MSKPVPTRRRLLDAAIRLFWRHGYNAVSVDAICEAAGANKGSLYHAFPSKTDLLIAALESVWASVSGELREREAMGGTARERLERHLDWYLDSQQRLLDEYGFVPGHFQIAIDADLEQAGERTLDQRAEYREMLHAIVMAVLAERGASAAQAAWLTDTIHHLVGGVMIEARVRNTLSPIHALKPTVLRLIELIDPRA